VKRGKRRGVRVENRLSLRQAAPNAPDSMTKKGLPDLAMLAMLLGCGLRPLPRSLPLRWPTFSRGITDGASSIGSASMAGVRVIPMPILSRSQTRLTGWGMLRSAYRRKRLWCLESALITDFIDGYIPHYICSALAIRFPPVRLIELLCANVTRQDPQDRPSKSDLEKVGASGRHKSDTNPLAPLFGIHIEPGQLSMVTQIHFVRRCGCGKPMDHPRFNCDDRARLEWVSGREVIPPRSIFGTKVIEVFIWQERPIGSLP